MKKDNSFMNDDTVVTAAEPATSADQTEVSKVSTDGFCIPSGVPQSVEEALTDIDEGEREFERHETFSHREVMQMIWGKIDNYAGKIQ